MTAEIEYVSSMFSSKSRTKTGTGLVLDNQTEQKQQVPAGGRFDEYPEVQVDSIKCN